MRKVFLAAACASLTMAPSALAQSDNTQEAASVVQEHIDAYRSGSLERFVATFAPDATVTVSGVTASGHSEIRAFYASNFAENSHTIRIVDSGMSDGRLVITAAYTFGGGEEQCCSYSEYEVSGGKIVSLYVTF